MKISRWLMVALLAGCLGDQNGLTGGDSPGGPSDADGGAGPGDPGTPGDGTDGGGDPGMCAGRAYTGFGGTDLTAGRVVGNIGDDRRRVLPYSALQTEYPRVLGATPASLASEAATFGSSQPRWYGEPQSSAISLYAAYSVAFDGCLATMAAKAQYATAPAAATAMTECTNMTSLYWTRAATSDELAACTTLAVTGLSSEIDPYRRWAYVCASVLTSDGFLTF
jgi:hypothetical protein